MYYFRQFPLTQMTDYNGNSVSLVNIIERVNILPSLLNNFQIFYSYDIKDGDRPETIANKYYSDVDRFWITMYSSQLFDYAADWPMEANLFADYMYDKYSSAAATYYSVTTATAAQVTAYTQLTIQNYVKQVVSVDNISLTTTTDNYYISQDEYNSLQTGSNTYNFPDGSSCTVTISKYTQSIYDFEVAENEAKRSINLLNNTYANQLEYQLTSNLSA